MEQWRKERNRALLALDLKWARERFPEESSDEVLLTAMHKARYECIDLPAVARQESRAWLEVRGFSRTKGLPFPSDGSLPGPPRR